MNHDGSQQRSLQPSASPAHGNALANDTLAIILAGGKGTRLGPLTRHICKPALPFGAAHRNIDFAMANCVNSGVSRIGVATQHQPHALLGHLERVWSAGASQQQCLIAPWHGEDRAPGVGYRGTADAVYRNLDAVERCGRKLVLILAGDHVYKMDYRPMLEQHCARRAAVTVGCVEVPISEARQFGIMSIDRTGRIGSFVEKPRALSDLPDRGKNFLSASMGIYVFDAELLAGVLRADALNAASTHDFGTDVLPRLIREFDAYAYRFTAFAGTRAYWRDIGTIATYWRAHMDLLERSPPVRLDDPQWPLPSITRATTQVDSIRGTGQRSLIAADAAIRGTVRHSVLFEGVEVRRGAQVSDSVILPNAVVETGCRLRGVIVDSGCRVRSGTVLEPLSDEAVANGAVEPAVLTAADTERLVLPRRCVA